MKAIDTNVAARFLLDDDPIQSSRAQAIMAGPVFLSATVLLELGWLLTSRYRLDRDVVSRILAQLIDLPTVTIAQPERIEWALTQYATQGDLADLIHVATSANAFSFVTFDRAIAANAGSASPIPVETLA